VPASILLISPDPNQQQAVGGLLRPPDYVLTAADGSNAVKDGGLHDLVIVDAEGDETAALELCRQLRANPALSEVPILCIGKTDDVEERIRYLEVGVDDVIGRPYHARELEARVEALVARSQRSRAADEGTDSSMAMGAGRRRTLAVFSPKGGVGTTTIAVNLAVVMATRRADDVLLVDLDLQFGAVAVHLDLKPRQTLVDLVGDDVALNDAESLRGYATRHGSGLHVLPGSPSPEQGEHVTVLRLNRLLRTAASTYGTVVVDAGSYLDERALQVLEWSDAVILPFQPEIPALKAVHSLLDYLKTTSAIGPKSIYVLNNAFARQALRMRDIEQALGTKVAVELPYDQMAYLNAANEGVPLVIGAPKSAPAMRLTSLADSVFGAVTTEARPEPAASGRLGGLLRRSEGVKRGR
jgi:pilus assembly protein CpaE